MSPAWTRRSARWKRSRGWCSHEGAPVKTFRFRLDQALRWRDSQVDLEKSRVSLAANRLAAIRTEIERRGTELKNSAALIATGGAGSSLQSWPAYASKSRRQIKQLEEGAREAERALAAQMQVLVEA